jgi:hypothetical protein
MPDNVVLPDPTKQPLCVSCGWLMWVALIEPHQDPELSKHTFKCHKCDYEEIKIVRLPPDSDD